MRVCKDDCDFLVEVLWYFVTEGTFIQNDVFVSSIWDDTPRNDGFPVGEMADGHVWRNGSVPPGAAQGSPPCGTPEQWAGDISCDDLQDTFCGPCSWQGHGCLCVHGKGAFWVDQLAGLGCLCFFGGGRGAPGAIWKGTGCLCVRRVPFTYSCACNYCTATYTTTSNYALTSCACNYGHATYTTTSNYALTSCACNYGQATAHGPTIFNALSCACNYGQAAYMEDVLEIALSCACNYGQAAYSTTATYVALSCACNSGTATYSATTTFAARSCACSSTTATYSTKATFAARSCACNSGTGESLPRQMPVFVANSGGSATGTISITPNVLFQNRDFLVALIAWKHGTGTAPAIPAGWVVINTGSVTGAQWAIYAQIYNGTATPVSWTSGDIMDGLMCGYRHAGHYEGFSANTGSGAPITSTSFTTTGGFELVLQLGITYSAANLASFGTATGYHQDGTFSQAPNQRPGLVVESIGQTAAGGTGSVTIPVASGTVGEWIVETMALYT